VASFQAKLRVVGIYFNRVIKFDDGGNPVTIDTLHNKAMSQFPISRKNGIFFTGSFVRTDGTISEKGNPIRTVSHNYSGKYDFNGNGSLKDAVDRDGATLGGYLRPKGIYELSEQLIENGLLAWQYYVMRGGKLVSKTPPERGFNPYEEFTLQDKDEVTWRLVSIATKPIAGSHRERRLQQ
jgi:hypothetical protein